MFWFTATAIGLLAAAIMAWPLLRSGSSLRNYGLALVGIVPLVSLFMYQGVGSLEGIGVTGTPVRQSAQPVNGGDHAATGTGQMAEMVAQLESRLQENPADTQGWVLLGRTYKTIQQYSQAEAALVRAAQLAPGDPLVLVELAEAKMFASGNPVIDQETRGMLEQALLLDPDQQKGLWLLGIAASQSGDDALSIELWERLSGLVEPGSDVAESLQEQIAQARARLGIEPAAEWPGLDIEVRVAADDYVAPAGAVLFVVARNTQMPGPPVGVKRIANPVFPVRVNLSDRDSMVPQLPVSGVESLQLVARLSMSGNVVAGAQDLTSEAIMIEQGSGQPVSLTLSSPGG